MDARLDLEQLFLSYGPNCAERIYGKHIEGPNYIIASVPFLSSLYSFCDIVRVRYVNGAQVVDSVVQPSSFRTVRCTGAHPENRAYQQLVQELDRAQCVIAWQIQRNTTSIAVPIARLADVTALLQAAERNGIVHVIDASSKSLTATA